MTAKNTLHYHKIPYTDVDLDQYPHLRDYVKKLTKRNAVPLIFFNDKFVGDHQDLQALVSAFQLLLEDELSTNAKKNVFQ